MPPIIVDFTSLFENYFIRRPREIEGLFAAHPMLPSYLKRRLFRLVLEHYFAYSADHADECHLWDKLSEEEVLMPIFDDGDAFMALSLLVSRLTEDIDMELRRTVEKLFRHHSDGVFLPSEHIPYEHYLFDRMLSSDVHHPQAIFVFHRPD